MLLWECMCRSESKTGHNQKNSNNNNLRTHIKESGRERERVANT